jgi:hypothetical protein
MHVKMEERRLPLSSCICTKSTDSPLLRSFMYDGIIHDEGFRPEIQYGCPGWVIIPFSGRDIIIKWLGTFI